MSNIFANLDLPVNARIYIVLKVPANKLARQLVEAEAVVEAAPEPAAAE